MSAYFDDVRCKFDARMTAHEGMLQHLGLAPSEEDAPLLFDALKATLMACGTCHCPKTCMEWQSDGDAGPPPWCHKRGTFLNLIEACAALEATRFQPGV